jgi:hypothetical protein
MHHTLIRSLKKVTRWVSGLATRTTAAKSAQCSRSSGFYNNIMLLPAAITHRFSNGEGLGQYVRLVNCSLRNHSPRHSLPRVPTRRASPPSLSSSLLETRIWYGEAQIPAFYPRSIHHGAKSHLLFIISTLRFSVASRRAVDFMREMFTSLTDRRQLVAFANSK